MPNKEQLEILLKEGVEYWNNWRLNNQGIKIELSDAFLMDRDLSNINLVDANLRSANLRDTNLCDAYLDNAILEGADLTGANLYHTKLKSADLRFAKLNRADLKGAILTGADLRNTILRRTTFVETDVNHVKISGSSVYGISVWNIKGDFQEQNDLIITPEGAPIITVDNVKIAQFIYLILNNEEIRDVINTLTSKAVLILGRFTGKGRKEILDSLRDKLRKYNLVPIVFDFDRPTDRDYTETIQTLTGLSLFVIVDVTNPRSTPLEMEATVKQFKIPYLPIIDRKADKSPFAMMEDLGNSFHWVLPTFGYNSKEELLENVEQVIINRALEKHNELRLQKAAEQKMLTIADLTKPYHRNIA